MKHLKKQTLTTKLWGEYDTDELISSFTIGDDLKYDALLLKYDIVATKAHIRMLENIDILTNIEVEKLDIALDELEKKLTDNSFMIPAVFEDGHSFLEAFLVDKCGEVGKKIHFLRSRNDQSLVMMRLFMKQKLDDIHALTAEVIGALEKQAEKNKEMLMPGYTHMQKAMPTRVDTWLLSFAAGLTDALLLVNASKQIVNQNPLGSGAGFGFIGQQVIPNREITTQLLGFKKTQQNPMYCGLSRGLYELMILQSIQPVLSLMSQHASDLLLYTMKELSYFSLPKNLTTGSSIMPQKHNYDVFELMRGSESVFNSYVTQIYGIISHRTSGYQRDLQLTKKPFIEAIALVEEVLNVWILTINSLKTNKRTLSRAVSPELYATQKANEKVMQGMSFRDAYIEIKQELEQL